MIVCEKKYPRSVRDHGQIEEMCLEFLGVLLVFFFLRFDTGNLCHFLLPVTPVSWLCTKEKDMLSESVANIDASSAQHAHASTLKLFGINH